MRKRRILAVAAAATLALSMVGCGSGGSSSGGSSSSGVANKDKPLCWFNRQPSNSSTGELDKDALSYNKDTYYVGFDANQGAELQGQMVLDTSRQMQQRSIVTVMESSDMYLQSVISDTMIQSHVQEVFVQHLAQELMQTEQLIQHQPEQT